MLATEHLVIGVTFARPGLDNAEKDNTAPTDNPILFTTKEGAPHRTYGKTSKPASETSRTCSTMPTASESSGIRPTTEQTRVSRTRPHQVSPNGARNTNLWYTKHRQITCRKTEPATKAAGVVKNAGGLTLKDRT